MTQLHLPVNFVSFCFTNRRHFLFQSDANACWFSPVEMEGHALPKTALLCCRTIHQAHRPAWCSRRFLHFCRFLICGTYHKHWRERVLLPYQTLSYLGEGACRYVDEVNDLTHWFWPAGRITARLRAASWFQWFLFCGWICSKKVQLQR